MKCKVVGKSTSSFINRSSGDLIDNSRLYLIIPQPKKVVGDTQYWGERVLDLLVPQEYVDSVEVGDTLSVEFDNKGKFDDLEVLSRASDAVPAPKPENKPETKKEK